MSVSGSQSVMGAVNTPLGAMSVSATTILTGVGNIFEMLQPIIGGVAAILGILVALSVLKDYSQKRILRVMEIKAMRRVAKFKKSDDKN